MAWVFTSVMIRCVLAHMHGKLRNVRWSLAGFTLAWRTAPTLQKRCTGTANGSAVDWLKADSGPVSNAADIAGWLAIRPRAPLAQFSMN